VEAVLYLRRASLGPAPQAAPAANSPIATDAADLWSGSSIVLSIGGSIGTEFSSNSVQAFRDAQ